MQCKIENLSIDTVIRVICEKDLQQIYNCCHRSCCWHIVKGKTRRFSKIIFSFLQVSQYHRYNIQITGYAINQGDGKNMKVSCMLTFKG